MIPFLGKHTTLTVSLALLLLIAGLFYFATETSYEIIESTSLAVRDIFGGFYLYLGLGCVLLLVGIAISPWENENLGKSQIGPHFQE